MAKSITLVFLPITLLLFSCSGGVPDIVPRQPDTVSLQATDWYIFYSEGVGDHPSPTNDGAWCFDFPPAPGSVHYVQTPYRWTAQHQFVQMTYKIATSPDAVFNAELSPGCTGRATLHLFLERRGDDLVNEYYRWWSNPIAQVLESSPNTVVTLTVPLTSDNWTNVLGHHDEGQFQQALGNLGWVGLTFGCETYFGHGVNMASGTARFLMIDYRIY